MGPRHSELGAIPRGPRLGFRQAGGFDLQAQTRWELHRMYLFGGLHDEEQRMNLWRILDLVEDLIC